MINHNQDPNQLDKKYDRRAKIAAWTAGVSGILGAAAAETTFAQPANAGVESASALEAQTPRAMIAAIDKKLSILQRDIESDPGRHLLSNITLKHENIYYIFKKNVSNPKHYDVLSILTAKGSTNPERAVVVMDAISTGKGENASFKGTSYSIDHLNTTGDDPTALRLTYYVPQKNAFAAYRVGTHKTSIPGDTEYADNPTAVSNQFNHFFQLADQILGNN